MGQPARSQQKAGESGGLRRGVHEITILTEIFNSLAVVGAGASVILLTGCGSDSTTNPSFVRILPLDSRHIIPPSPSPGGRKQRDFIHLTAPC